MCIFYRHATILMSEQLTQQLDIYSKTNKVNFFKVLKHNSNLRLSYYMCEQIRTLLRFELVKGGGISNDLIRIN